MWSVVISHRPCAGLLLLLFWSSSVSQGTAEWAASCQGQVMWNVRNEVSNDACIMMTGVYQFIVPYLTTAGQTDFATVHITENATATGTCGTNSSREQSMTLTWPVQSDIDDGGRVVENTATFTFTRNSTTGSPDGVEGYFCLQKVKAALQSNKMEFPGAVELGKTYVLDAFNMEVMATPLGMSFFCDSVQDYVIGDSTLRMQHTQFEIFHKKPVIKDAANFSPKSYCLADGLRILVTAAILTILLISTGAVVIYLFKRSSSSKGGEYGELK